MKNQLLSIILTLLVGCSFSQNATIEFKIKNLGLTVNGVFKTFSITTNYDASNSLQNFSGEIKVKSIDTGIDSRDKHLLEENYFHESKYPLIKFDAAELYKKSDKTYAAKVSLWMKGKTKALTIPLQIEIRDKQRKITSQFEINRKDFDVGGSSFLMSKTVKIKVVHIENIQ